MNPCGSLGFGFMACFPSPDVCGEAGILPDSPYETSIIARPSEWEEPLHRQPCAEYQATTDWAAQLYLKLLRASFKDPFD
ncbi:Uncharacterized protein DAT39_001642 [Clarias magur]|uniref:Uncharacterized protein n=1 Tax=Clarias magur TaxID=1594786 RepID=A0A8J4U7Z4_CLAMG|nr:Uncharacterized protein DAT39_001642 [Clarias magur]